MSELKNLPRLSLAILNSCDWMVMDAKLVTVRTTENAIGHPLSSGHPE